MCATKRAMTPKGNPPARCDLQNRKSLHILKNLATPLNDCVYAAVQ